MAAIRDQLNTVQQHFTTGSQTDIRPDQIEKFNHLIQSDEATHFSIIHHDNLLKINGVEDKLGKVIIFSFFAKSLCLYPSLFQIEMSTLWMLLFIHYDLEAVRPGPYGFRLKHILCCL